MTTERILKRFCSLWQQTWFWSSWQQKWFWLLWQQKWFWLLWQQKGFWLWWQQSRSDSDRYNNRSSYILCYDNYLYHLFFYGIACSSKPYYLDIDNKSYSDCYDNRSDSDRYDNRSDYDRYDNKWFWSLWQQIIMIVMMYSFCIYRSAILLQEYIFLYLFINI